MDVEKSEAVVFSKFLNHLRCARQVHYVSLLDQKVRRSELLADSADKSVLTGTSSELEYIDSVFVIDIQVCDSLVDGF